MNDHIEWDDNTPPSICLAEPDSRMILATYALTTWEFTPSTQSPRWGTDQQLDEPEAVVFG